MTTKTRSVPMRFYHIQFATAIRGECLEFRFSLSEIDALAGMEGGAAAQFAGHLNPNPKMQTYLAICNTLGLDPCKYFGPAL